MPRELAEQLLTAGFCTIEPRLSDARLDRLRRDFSRLVAGDSPSHSSVRGALQKSDAVHHAAAFLNPAASALLGKPAFPTKGTLFDKTAEANWLVPWHQDLTITVSARADVAGFSQWRQRDGIWHVQPPVSFLERTVALRLHLDPCPAENGALKVIPGSHQRGVLSADQVHLCVRATAGIVVPVGLGEVLAMAPLVVHASSKSAVARHRRVLHLEYCSVGLPPPLEWCA